MGPLRIDIPALFERLLVEKDEQARPNYVPLFQDRFHRLFYGSRILPLGTRVRLKALLRRIEIDNLWLKHFESYWVQLGGRPLWHSSDFFFLRNFYRIRQRPPKPWTAQTNDDHLAAWQDPESIYHLFHAVLKETFSSEYHELKLLATTNPNFSSALEFGCGSAPITSSILQHRCQPRDANFAIADLPTLTFHYATYKFRKCSNVQPIMLLPKDHFRLETDRKFDVIFCREVFEHLNEPLETVEMFHQILNKGGVLFFDYIKSEARGLDTLQGLQQRDDVLDFMTKTFRPEYGTIQKERSVGLTVVRKVN
jgi:SAM-dependent methyltransferase